MKISGNEYFRLKIEHLRSAGASISKKQRDCLIFKILLLNAVTAAAMSRLKGSGMQARAFDSCFFEDGYEIK
jgi:hypothetical protein